MRGYPLPIARTQVVCLLLFATLLWRQNRHSIGVTAKIVKQNELERKKERPRGERGLFFLLF
jgi:hypothetical protein